MTRGAAPVRVGLDLDGTIVLYDGLFHEQAATRLGLPAGVPRRKEAVRDWLRAQPEGERRWVELQGLVYGPLMPEAPAATGAVAFLRSCREHGIDVSVASHRTRKAVADPSVDLHAAALAWLEERGLFDEGSALERDRVFLEPTRAAKVARIAAEECVLFVDDLDLVFTEPGFPATTERWLFSPERLSGFQHGVHVFADWEDVRRRALELRDAGLRAR